MLTRGQIVVVLLLLVSSYVIMLNRSTKKLYHQKEIFLRDGEKHRDNVRIIRDQYGVAHIYGETDPDSAFGMAFALAEDNFEMIQSHYVKAKGIQASIEGKQFAGGDLFVHWTGIVRTVDKEYEEKLSIGERRYIEAYANGINYYAALHENEIVHAGLYPITGKDVLVHSLLTIQSFAKISNLVNSLQKHGDSRIPKTQEGVKGSNAFAVSPLRTDDRNSTFLNINPHSSWEVKSNWYEVHLNSKTKLNMVGFTLPGIPVILMGHNEHLGWAHTVNRPDIVDIFHLTLDGKTRYLFDGQYESFTEYEVPIKVSFLSGTFWWTYSKTVYESRYGPVVQTPQGAVAISFSGFHAQCLLFVKQYLLMNKASSFGEWEKGLKIQGMPLFNTVYGDQEGNIFYHYGGRIPKRNSQHNWADISVNGISSDVLWKEFYTYEELPKLKNPPAGFVQNCNSSPFNTTTSSDNPIVDEFDVSMGIETSLSNRAHRALELFSSNDKVSWEDFKQYKFDSQFSSNSTFIELMNQLIEHLSVALQNEEWASENPYMSISLEIMKKWDRTATIHNRQAAVPVLTLYPFIQHDLWTPDPAVYARNNVSVLVSRLNSVIAALVHSHSRLDVEWGEVHRLRHQNGLDLPLSGGPDLLNTIYSIPAVDKFIGAGGDGPLMLVRWNKDGVHSEAIHPFGTVDITYAQKRRSDQTELFTQHKLRKVCFYEEHVKQQCSESEYFPGEVPVVVEN